MACISIPSDMSCAAVAPPGPVRHGEEEAEDLCLSRLRQAVATGTIHTVSRGGLTDNSRGRLASSLPASQSARPNRSSDANLGHSAASAIDDDDAPILGSVTTSSSMEEQLRTVSAVMESDLVAIRQDIIGDRKGDESSLPSDLTPEEERKVQHELRRRHQVDLNDERNLADLEDKGLMSHMVQARKTLAEQTKKQQMLPKSEDTRVKHVKNLRHFSSLVQGLQSAGLELQCGVEETFLQSNNSVKLSKGERPHSFPEVPNGKPANRDALVLLAERIDKSALQCHKSNTAITDTVNGIDVLRREYEVVVDAYVKLLNHYQASHEALEQLLGGHGQNLIIL
jgi:hypothetical protein